MVKIRTRYRMIKKKIEIDFYKKILTLSIGKDIIVFFFDYYEGYDHE